jgi:excisionase family DNA binding protein
MLDDIARDPGKASTLPAAVRRALIVQAAAVLAALAAGMVPDSHQDTLPDRLLTVKEAADRLGLSEDYLYRHARTLPFFVRPNGSRTVRFSQRGIERYLRDQQQRRDAS